MQDKNGKKVLKKMIILLKKEIVTQHEHAIHVADLASEYKVASPTTSIILKNEDAIKEAEVAKGVTMLISNRHECSKRWKNFC